MTVPVEGPPPIEFDVAGPLTNALGNLEAKTGAFAWMVAQDRPLTRRDMGSLSSQALAAGADWAPGGSGVFGYCRSTFAASDLVHLDHTQSLSREVGTTQTFEVSERGRTVGAAAAGLFGEWGLDNENSTQLYFGDRRTQPDNRLILFAKLVADKSGLSVVDLMGPRVAGLDTSSTEYKRRLDTLATGVYTLEDEGVLQVEHITDDNDSRYRVEDPTMPQSKVPRNDVSPIIYGYMKERQASRDRTGDPKELEFTFEACLGYVQGELPKHDPSFVRTKVREMLLNDTCLPGLVRLDESYNDGGHTRVRLEPAHQESIADLLTIARALETEDPVDMQHGRQMAAHIGNNSQLLARLFTKSAMLSPGVNQQPRVQTKQQLREIVEAHPGGIELSVVRASYREEHGKRLSRTTASTILAQLSRAGVLHRERVRVSPTTAYTRLFYFPVQGESD